MRIVHLFTFLALVISLPAFGEDYPTLITTAQAHHKAGEYSAAVANFEAAFKIQSDQTFAFYSGARAAAKAGNPDLALTWLQRAVDLGWANPQHTQSDPDLASLHEAPLWPEILTAMRARRKALDASIDKPLRTQLRAILADDQKYRVQIEALEKKFGPNSEQVRDLWKVADQKDADNLKQVTAILDTRGWLGPDVVGDDGNGALFLVIQHADLKTQEKYLPMMRAAVKNKKAQASDLAMLEDRVLMGEGRRQIYGSQLHSHGNTGKYELWPIEDPDHVDERRASVGLIPLAEYVKFADLTWDVAEHKKQHPPTEKLKADEP